MKTKYYRQCYLRKGNVYTTSYIPEVFAHVGNVLKLKENDTWDDGWKVLQTGQKVDAKYVESNERNYLNHRKATDI